MPSGVWHPDEYLKLPRYDGTTGEQAEAGAIGAFFCHQQDGRLCAGWVGCHDMDESLGMRLAVSHGLISESDYEAAVNYVSPVPLFATGAEACAHGMTDVPSPGVKARSTIDRLERKRNPRKVKQTDA